MAEGYWRMFNSHCSIERWHVIVRKQGCLVVFVCQLRFRAESSVSMLQCGYCYRGSQTSNE